MGVGLDPAWSPDTLAHASLDIIIFESLEFRTHQTRSRRLAPSSTEGRRIKNDNNHEKILSRGILLKLNVLILNVLKQNVVTLHLLKISLPTPNLLNSNVLKID